MELKLFWGAWALTCNLVSPEPKESFFKVCGGFFFWLRALVLFLMLTLVLLRFRPLWLYERNTAPVNCYPSSWHELPSRVSYCSYLAFFLWLIACGKRQTSTRPGSGFLSEIYVQMFKTSKYNPNSFIHFLLHKFIFSTERHFYCANRPLLHVHVRLLYFEQSYFFLLNTCSNVLQDLASFGR